MESQLIKIVTTLSRASMAAVPQPCRIWLGCVRDAGLSCRVEPRHEYVNNDDRPNIVAFGTKIGESFELDISLAHPWSSKACCRAAVEDGTAAIIREERKIEK